MNRKRLLLLGFLLILLAVIPVTVFFVQQQQQTRSNASAATVLSFTPDSTPTGPITKNIGDTFSVKLVVNPSTNQVGTIKLHIQYDATKLATIAATPQQIANDIDPTFQRDTTTFAPEPLEGPIYRPGEIFVTLSVGNDFTKAVKTQSNIGTLTFKTLAQATAQPLLTYGDQTAAYSFAGSSDSGDAFDETIIASTLPAYIQVDPAGTPTNTPTPTQDPDNTPAPTQDPGSTPAPTSGIQPTSVPNNNPPICSGLTNDISSGTAPLSVSFTAIGSDTDGTVNKVSFNFGDGPIIEATTGGGIGTASINNTIEHTYSRGGTYTASVVLTDDKGSVSSATTCSQTITVAAASPEPTTVAVAPTTPPDVIEATPTMTPPGAGDVFLSIGGITAIVSVIGAVLFFAL